MNGHVASEETGSLNRTGLDSGDRKRHKETLDSFGGFRGIGAFSRIAKLATMDQAGSRVQHPEQQSRAAPILDCGLLDVGFGFDSLCCRTKSGPEIDLIEVVA